MNTFEIPVGDEQDYTSEKTCEDCTHFLLCRKAKTLDNLPPICAKFEDNFPEDEEDEDDDIEDTETDSKVILHVCDHATQECKDIGCVHAVPHDPFDDEQGFDGACTTPEECGEEFMNKMAVCKPL
jgi:hypothetical protein